MTKEIDLNCDMGESLGIFKIGNDEEMMKHVTSISVGCGFHGGDPHVMQKTVTLAKQHGVAIGAHPGLPDIIGFGRRKMEVTPDEARDYIIYQAGALKAFCDAADIELQHIKPHGQLYNMAWSDEALARGILEGIRAFKPQPLFLALHNTIPYNMAEFEGVRVAGEFYADLEYAPDGTTFIKKTHGDIDVKATLDRTLKMVLEGKVTASNGEEIEVKGRSICFHGDNPRAPEIVQAVRKGLEKNGVKIMPLWEQFK